MATSEISAQSLQHLHDLYVQYEEIKEKLERGPRQVQTRRQRLEQQRREAEQCHQSLLQLKKSIDEKNLQLRTTETKIEELKVKLNMTKSTREYEIIRAQIEADRMANSVLEDEIIELLEKVDKMKVECERLEEQYKKTEQEVNQFAEKVSQEEPRLREQLEQLEKEILEAEKTAIPEKIAQDYQRLVGRYGATALAPAMDDACSQCFVSLSPQNCIDLRAGKIVFCKNCGRILYLPTA